MAEKKYIANTGNDSLFVNEFLDKYLSLGFGNLPKKEIDILVFGLLNRCGYLKGKNNYEIARNLQIDENRLRRLFLDSSLRTGSSHDFRDSIKALYKDLADETIKPEIYNDKKTIAILVSDPVQKSDFVYALRLLGYSYSGNLNPERIELPTYVFAAVFWEYNEEAHKQFAKLTAEALKTQTAQEKAAFGTKPFLVRAETILRLLGPAALKTIPGFLQLVGVI